MVDNDDEEYRLQDSGTIEKAVVPPRADVEQCCARADKAITLLQKAAAENRPIDDKSRTQIVQIMDRTIGLYLQIDGARAAYNTLQGRANLAESLHNAYASLEKTLRVKNAKDPASLIAQLFKKATQGRTISTLPEWEWDKISADLENVCRNIIAGKADPLESTKIEVENKKGEKPAEELFLEDPVVRDARAFLSAAIEMSHFLKTEGLTVDSATNTLCAEAFRKEAKPYARLLDPILRELCELVHDRDDMDLSTLSSTSKKQFDKLFPSVQIDQAAPASLSPMNSWRHQMVIRQLGEDYELLIREELVRNRYASINMEQWKTNNYSPLYYAKAMEIVEPLVRPELAKKVAYEITYMAKRKLGGVDESSANDFMPRYAVEIPATLVDLLEAGNEEEARTFAIAHAKTVIDQCVPFKAMPLNRLR